MDLDLENYIDISSYNGSEYTPTKSGIFYAQYLPSANNNFTLSFKDECRKTAGGANIIYMHTIVANQWFTIERYVGKRAFTYTAPSINTSQSNRGFFFIPFK